MDYMEKQRIIDILVLFTFLASLEAGFFIEVLWHGWAGFGAGNVLEYNEKGEIGTTFLLFFIPVSVIIIYLIRIITLFIKKHNNLKELFFFDFICVLYCIPITILIAFTTLLNPIVSLGRMIASFLIDHYTWMSYVIP